MKRSLLFLFAIPWMLLSTRGEEPVSDTPLMTEARKVGIAVVQLMQKRLAEQSAKDLPGVEAWLNTEGKSFAALNKDKPDSSWRQLDGDKLFTRSANFWQLHYEVAPGDPGLTLLHAGGLLAAGDATRALTLMRLTMHRNDFDKETFGIFDSVMQQCDKFAQPSHALVAQGIKLHDARDYDGALAKYESALRLWPHNGWAAFELANTLNSRNEAGDREAARKALALSRSVEPTQWNAWQGSMKEVPGVIEMRASVRPLWQKSLKSLTFVMDEKQLEELANGWQAAEVDDLALITRQVLVVRKGRYLPEDHPFIAKSLRRLVPGQQTETSLTKLSKGPLNVIRLSNAPVPGQMKENGQEKGKEKKP